MTKFGISEQGSAALRQLSSDLKNANKEIEQSSKTLIATISGLGEDLGMYEQCIIELAKKIEKSQESAKDSVEDLAEKLTKMASNIDALVGKGLR